MLRPLAMLTVTSQAVIHTQEGLLCAMPTVGGQGLQPAAGLRRRENPDLLLHQYIGVLPAFLIHQFNKRTPQ